MKKVLIVVMAVMIVAALGGCGQEKEKPAVKMQELTVGIMPDIDSIPFIIAQEKGYFKEEGITVNIKPFKSAMDRDSALQSGNLDGVVSDLLAAAFAKAGGFDIKVTSMTSGSYKMVASESSAIASTGDLKGKDVAVSKNTIIEYVTDKILSEQGMQESDIKKVVIPQIPTRLEMLQNGKLAAATLPEPMASAAIAKGGKLLHSSDQLGINPGIMLFTNQAVTDKKAELQAMYRAYNKAVAYLEKEDRASYIDLIIEKCGFPAVVKDSLVLPKYKQAQLPEEKEVNDCMQWMMDKKLIKTQYKYNDLVESSLLK